MALMGGPQNSGTARAVIGARCGSACMNMQLLTACSVGSSKAVPSPSRNARVALAGSNTRTDAERFLPRPISLCLAARIWL